MRWNSRAGGQALVEFALIAPFLFLLLFSIIEFARFVYQSEILSSATREGGRYAIVHGSESVGPSGPGSSDPSAAKVKAIVQNYAIGVIRDGDFTIAVCYPGGLGTDPISAPNGCAVNNDPGSYVKVTIDYRYKLLVPFVPLPNVQMHAESILVINH